MTERESSIETHVNDYAKSIRITARKLNFGEGWPDRMYLYRGHILFIEYKRKGEKTTPLQEYTHGLLRKQGFLVIKIDDKQKGVELIKDWHDRIDSHMATFCRSDDPIERLGSYVLRNPWLE